jgi:hypothetical protein
MRPQFLFATWLLAASLLAADTLPNTHPLTVEGDIASQMIDTIDRFLLKELDKSVERRSAFWKRDFSSEQAYSLSIEPNRAHLAHILGARDERPGSDAVAIRAGRRKLPRRLRPALPPQYHPAMQTQLAKMAFDLVCGAPIRGADAENVAAVKRWLQQIGSGQLVVGTPAPPKQKKTKPEPTRE